MIKLPDVHTRIIQPPKMIVSGMAGPALSGAVARVHKRPRQPLMLGFGCRSTAAKLEQEGFEVIL